MAKNRIMDKMRDLFSEWCQCDLDVCDVNKADKLRHIKQSSPGIYSTHVFFPRRFITLMILLPFIRTYIYERVTFRDVKKFPVVFARISSRFQLRGLDLNSLTIQCRQSKFGLNTGVPELSHSKLKLNAHLLDDMNEADRRIGWYLECNPSMKLK
jgi:hypothetical protein